MKDFSEFEDAIGITFSDKKLLRRAFTHRSYLNENSADGRRHNERLEFLGDAVMELVVTRYLFEKYPDTPEGDLTSYRSSLVRTETISDAALKLDVNDFLLLSKGEAKDTGKARAYILANTFEAIVGAIYLDQGYDSAAGFIDKALFHRIDEIVEKGLHRDAKSYVQEKAQEILSVTPSYDVLEESGPDHAKQFVIGIYFEDKLIAKGEGQSKQEAQQNAAKAALAEKGWS